MCLLTYFPAGVMPDTAALENGMFINSDGHGYAIVSDDRIIVGRGLNGEDILDEFEALRFVHPDGPALFHSRLATDGAEDVSNVHPFPIGGDHRTVMAHNGIMPLRPSKGDPRSDTRLVAESFIPRTYRSLRGRKARLRFQRWMGTYNKVVILTVDNRFRDQAYILNEREGIWRDGIWYSNDGYKPWLPSSVKYVYGDDQLGWPEYEPMVLGKAKALTAQPRDEVIGVCPLCTVTFDLSLTECPCCGWCTDCEGSPAECQCFWPGASPTPRRWSVKTG